MAGAPRSSLSQAGSAGFVAGAGPETASLQGGDAVVYPADDAAGRGGGVWSGGSATVAPAHVEDEDEDGGDDEDCDDEDEDCPAGEAVIPVVVLVVVRVGHSDGADGGWV